MDEHFGGFWRRAMAFFIDKVILFFISMLTLLLGILALGIGFPSHYQEILPEGLAELSVKFMVIYFLMSVMLDMFYFTYFHGTVGQTPGKMMFGLKVVQSTGERMTLGIGFLRWVGYVVSKIFFYLGFIWIAFDGKKQGWHDKIAGTIVLRGRNVVEGASNPPDEKDLDKDRDIL
jgi:uncharacterized RDD family membrane protein YckC